MLPLTVRVSRFLSVPAAILLWLRVVFGLLKLAVALAFFAVLFVVFSGGEP